MRRKVEYEYTCNECETKAISTADKLPDGWCEFTLRHANGKGSSIGHFCSQECHNKKTGEWYRTFGTKRPRDA